MAEKVAARGWTDTEKVMKTIGRSMASYHELLLTLHRSDSSFRSSPKVAQSRGRNSFSQTAAL
jgi:hypothetical protein